MRRISYYLSFALKHEQLVGDDEAVVEVIGIFQNIKDLWCDEMICKLY